MNIILVSNKMAKPKTLSLFQIIGLGIVLLLISAALTAFFFIQKSDTAQEVMMLKAQLEKSMNSSQMHLDAYAKQIGELQARIMRLDAQNQRLVNLAGAKDDKSKKNNIADLEPIGDLMKPNFGGPLVNARPMTESDLQDAITKLVSAVGSRDEYMSLIEADVLQNSVLKDMLPNSKPISAAYRSSSYGWRIDPFHGTKAFHEGLDFTAKTGTPIRAAADGIVSAATNTAAYGNLIKLNHGAGLETRYAHASKLLVKLGERVVKGQTIALVGSTGRSTGPHLHYEIRLNGHPLDPRKYLNKNLD
ncbi:MAG TPA: M23 family metallopeptidase [Methylophilaceae bacterium]|nr:M23 family metallopeptidase [Methylophilaceae bacterium]